MNIETKTINDLRTISTTPTVGTYYYVTDPGKEGEWYYDGDDNSTVDNSGTVITSPSNPSPGTSRKVFRRVFDAGFVNAPWFFESSDPDATLGIQRALDFISNTSNFSTPYSETVIPGGGTVFLPKGIYKISDTLLVGYNCTIKGVSNKAIDNGVANINSLGSVIKCAFQNPNKWAISSASRIGNWNLINPSPPPIFFPDNPWGLAPENVLPFDKYISSKAVSSTLLYGYDRFTRPQGILIENIVIDGMIEDEEGAVIANAFGGIRLANSFSSTIRNVRVINAKVGIMLNTSWYATIENSFVNALWYGAAIVECNIAGIIGCNFRGTLEDDGIVNYKPLIEATDLPDFIYHDQPYSNWGLNDTIKFGKTGIYSFGTELTIINTGVEQTTNGFTLLNGISTLEGTYSELNLHYGVSAGINDLFNSKLVVNGFSISNSNYGFLFGNNLIASLVGVNQSFYGSGFINELFDPYLNTGRNITFSKTTFVKRKYTPDILFSDEGENGQNYGSIYVDPVNGNDDNYGFNKNDAIKTFDAALIRVQNQSTINPVKTIFINAAEVSSGASGSVASAIKNIEKISLQNCNILVTTYNETENIPYATIFFEPENFTNANIGQVELLGNSSLTFRNVRLFTYYPGSTTLNNTMFGIANGYARLQFEYSFIIWEFNPIEHIFLHEVYHLVQANIPTLPFVGKSYLEVKFVNTIIRLTSLASLSPNQFGNKDLAVDCQQVNSYANSLGFGLWLDAEILRNNF